MIYKILQYPDPVLLQKSKDITDINDDIIKLISDMIETCKMTENCVGLAAIQIGIPIRLSVIKHANKFINIINPEIIYRSGEITGEWEGCMSVGVGDDQLFAKVQRDNKITVRYLDKTNKVITRQATGFLAHAFQHEIDHMDGMLFLKYISDPKLLWKDKDLNVYINKHNSLPV